jgi:hypothetical protein
MQILIARAAPAKRLSIIRRRIIPMALIALMNAYLAAAVAEVLQIHNQSQCLWLSL